MKYITKLPSLLFLIVAIASMIFVSSCKQSDTSTKKPTATNQSKNKNGKVESKQLPNNTTGKSKTEDKQTILFFGNSLSAGYGLDKNQAFPALIQNKIDSLQMPYKVVNAGLSGETTAGGLRRIEWILRQKVDVFVLELGGNDGLRGTDTESTYNNLKGIIDIVQKTYPACKIVLAGMEAPPNMGDEFTSKFRENYKRLAKEYDLTLIPFLLDKVGGVPALNLPDGIHPTPKGHQIVAGTVWKYLEGVL